MITVTFDDKVKIGLQYILENLHGCSPFGIERIRRLKFYAPEEREALEEELYNVEGLYRHAAELKSAMDKTVILLCQMKDIRNSFRRCAAGETPDQVELFAMKGCRRRLESLIPL